MSGHRWWLRELQATGELGYYVLHTVAGKQIAYGPVAELGYAQLLSALTNPRVASHEITRRDAMSIGHYTTNEDLQYAKDDEEYPKTFKPLVDLATRFRVDLESDELMRGFRVHARYYQREFNLPENPFPFAERAR